MEFSKAIEIKNLVVSWNEHRKAAGFGFVKFECTMFSIGKWSVELSARGADLFFSDEMRDLLKLDSKGGFSMRIFAYDNVPIIDMQ